MNVLFVCSSNICRSPYCEYMFRKMTEEDPVLKGQVTVASSAVVNHMRKMDPRTRSALLREGFDAAYVDAHKPGILYRDLDKFRNADVIIGMTKWHKAFIPFAWKGKFLTLSEAALGTYVPVDDPWTLKDINDYYKSMDSIRAYLEQYLTRLKTAQTAQTAQNEQTDPSAVFAA